MEKKERGAEQLSPGGRNGAAGGWSVMLGARGATQFSFHSIVAMRPPTGLSPAHPFSPRRVIPPPRAVSPPPPADTRQPPRIPPPPTRTRYSPRHVATLPPITPHAATAPCRRQSRAALAWHVVNLPPITPHAMAVLMLPPIARCSCGGSQACPRSLRAPWLSSRRRRSRSACAVHCESACRLVACLAWVGLWSRCIACVLDMPLAGLFNNPYIERTVLRTARCPDRLSGRHSDEYFATDPICAPACYACRGACRFPGWSRRSD